MQLQVIEFLPPTGLQRTGCNLIPGSSDSDEHVLPEWIKVELKRGVLWKCSEYGNRWRGCIKIRNEHAVIFAARGLLPNEYNRLEIYCNFGYDPLFINAKYRITIPESDMIELIQELDDLDIHYEPTPHTLGTTFAPHQIMWVPLCDDLRRVVMSFLTW